MWFFNKPKTSEFQIAKARIFATFSTASNKDECPERYVLKSKLVATDSPDPVIPQYVLDLSEAISWSRNPDDASYFYVKGKNSIEIHDKLNIILLDFNLKYSQLTPEFFHTYGVITDMIGEHDPKKIRTLDFINKVNASTPFEKSAIYDLLISAHKHYISDIIVNNHKTNGSFHVKIRCTEKSFKDLAEEFTIMVKELHKILPNTQKMANTHLKILKNNSDRFCAVLTLNK